MHLLLERARGGRLRAAARPCVPAVPARTAGAPVLPRRGQVPGQVRQGVERVLQKSALQDDSFCLLENQLCIFVILCNNLINIWFIFIQLCHSHYNFYYIWTIILSLLVPQKLTKYEVQLITFLDASYIKQCAM